MAQQELGVQPVKLSSLGTKVVVNYSRSLSEAEDTYKQLSNDGLLYQADISDERQVKEMIHACFQKFGKLDYLVNNVGSVAGITGLGSSVPYAVTKAAVHGLTKSLAFSLAPSIRINCIAPGAVDTRWWKGSEDKMKTLAGNILLKRISTPQDIAETICYTLLQKSLAGQIITVDNGQTM